MKVSFRLYENEGNFQNMGSKKILDIKRIDRMKLKEVLIIVSTKYKYFTLFSFIVITNKGIWAQVSSFDIIALQYTDFTE